MTQYTPIITDSFEIKGTSLTKYLEENQDKNCSKSILETCLKIHKAHTVLEFACIDVVYSCLY